MSAGTLTLTNNSDAVTGKGTAFTTELAAGDFIVVTVGGVPYTLPVKSVESDTELALVSVFTGPTQSGAAWSAVPRVALNMVTAALVTQSAEALRGLNYDKQNWQQVFSGSGEITVKLPDNSTFTGPSWKYLSENMATKTDGAVPINQGGTGSTSAPDARKKLGLVDSNDVVPVSMGGTGGKNISDAQKSLGVLSNTPVGYGDLGVGQHIQHACGHNLFTIDMFNCYWYIQPDDLNYGVVHSVSYSGNGANDADYGRVLYAIRTHDYGIRYVECKTTKNTTADSNGFLKIASPIVKIFNDGKYETNDESAGCTVTRLGVGKYLIEGCVGLNSDAAWGGIDGGFEIPIDRNKLARIWLDYEVNADGSVLVKTYHRTHPEAPEFARNEINGLTNGEPVDIPADSFVSVRVEMPPDSICNQRQNDALKADVQKPTS